MVAPMRALGLCCALLLLLAGCGGNADGGAGDGELAGRADAFALSLGVDEFLLSPSTLAGEALAAAMASTGDQRWVPWLIDLLRLGRSTSLDRAAAGALETLTGIEATHRRVEDLVAYGGWMYDRAVDPGPGYPAWKIRLYERIDPGYRQLLGQVADPIVLSRIQFGGVVRGGIPELDRPERLTITQAAHMHADEVVYGTGLGGTEVAYPLRILGHHELVNDVIEGRPVAMTLCTLCRTAVLFDRRVDGRELYFETSGLLLNSNKVMVDRQTDTLWNQLTGEAFAGPMAGAALTKLPSEAARWGDWVADHPDSLTLDFPRPVVFDDPERAPISYEYEPGAAQSTYYESDEVWFPIFDAPDVFALKDEVLTVELEGAHLAVGVDALAEHGPVVLALGDGAVLVVPTGAGGRVYDAGAAVGPGELTVGGPVGLDPAMVTPEAVTLASGTELPRLLSGQSFWFAWYGAHPDTAWWPAGE
jgi:Protein of unknown function (DUF3179)